jgi:hypothetical protein
MSDAKIFLKCGKTGRWYGAADGDSGQVSRAREFATVEEAMRVGQELGEHVMVVVLHRGKPERATVLPEGEEGGC